MRTENMFVIESLSSTPDASKFYHQQLARNSNLNMQCGLLSYKMC